MVADSTALPELGGGRPRLDKDEAWVVPGCSIVPVRPLLPIACWAGAHAISARILRIRPGLSAADNLRYMANFIANSERRQFLIYNRRIRFVGECRPRQDIRARHDLVAVPG